MTVGSAGCVPAGRSSLGRAGVRAVRRLVPQRRHPPPAEDDGARVARANAPSSPASRRRRRSRALQPGHAALGAARPAATASPPLENIPLVELARAARQVLGLQRAHQRRYPLVEALAGARRRVRRLALRRRPPPRSARCCSSGSPSRSPSSTTTPACLPDDLTLPLVWIGAAGQPRRRLRAAAATR